MPKELWIVIIVVCVLIALYIVYLIASNRRFHRMVDPHIAKLRAYEEARHRAAHAMPEGVEAEPIEKEIEEPDYNWEKEDKK